MTDCFWTDFVGCAENCGSAPTGPAVLLGLGAAMGAGSSGNGDAIPYLPATGVRIAGTLEFQTVTVYTPGSGDGSGCTWAGFIATTDAGLAGTTISNAYDAYGTSGHAVTWKLVSDLAKTFLASGTHVALSPDGDGLGGSVINTTALLAALGSPVYTRNGLLIVATLHNVTTGDTWEATWLLDTCF